MAKKRRGRQQKPARSSQDFIGQYQQAPHFLRDNQHIIKGYRIGFNSPKKVIKSVFMIHNETVNIWTHLIGAIIIIFFIFEGIAYEMEENHTIGKAIINEYIDEYRLQMSSIDNILGKQGQSLQDQEFYKSISSLRSSKNKSRYDLDVPTWPILIALLGGAICLGCSAVYHWIHPMSEKMFKMSLGLDFAGIGINMAFSPIPAFYYTMYCERQTAISYIVIIFIAGTVSFVASLFDWIHKRQHIILKAIIMSISATICAFGLIHIIINEFVYQNYGDKFTIVPALYFFIPTLLSYLIGFIIYSTRCPERFHPGRYDICGHSHQLWHIFVFLAVVFTYLGSLVCYQIRSQRSICPNNYAKHFL